MKSFDMFQSEETPSESAENDPFCGDPSCLCAATYSPKDAASRATVLEMLAACDDILTSADGLTYGTFIKNNPLHNEMVLKLKIIQETALSLPADFKDKNLKTDWDSIQNVYTQAVHPAFGLNPETLWDLVRLDLPFLRQCLDIIINGCTHVY